MSYTAKWKALQNPDFRGRVAMCARAIARNILNEPADPGGRTSRKALANRVLDNVNVIEDRITLALVAACVEDETIAGGLSEAEGTSSAPDSAFEAAITAAWDDLSSESRNLLA